jgi:hypothetical protein
MDARTKTVREILQSGTSGILIWTNTTKRTTAARTLTAGKLTLIATNPYFWNASKYNS